MQNGQRKTVGVYARFHAGREIIPELEALGFGVKTFAHPDELAKMVEAGERFAALMDVNIHDEVFNCCLRFDIPYLCWTFDSGGTLAGTLPFRPCDYLFFYDKQDAAAAKARGHNAWYLPFSAGTMFHREPRDADFRFSMLVVMNIYMYSVEQNERTYQQTLSQLPPGVVRDKFVLLRQISDLLIGEHRERFTTNTLRTELERQIESNGIPFFRGQPAKLDAFAGGLGQELAYSQRLKLVETLAALGPVDVFGDEYWQKILPGIPSARYHGLSAYDGLADLYNGAEITYNLTQPQCLNSIPQRVFHVLAAGGFLLTPRSEVTAEQFQPGVHLDMFGSFEELSDKSAFYRRQPELRRRIARAGHAEFLHRHTMRDRLRFIFDQVRLG